MTSTSNTTTNDGFDRGPVASECRAGAAGDTLTDLALWSGGTLQGIPANDDAVTVQREARQFPI